MGIAGFVGFIVNLLSSSVAKIIAILGAFSFGLFLLSAINSGSKIDNIPDLSSWISIFITNVVPLLLSYCAEGTGAGLGIKLRRYLSN